MEEGLNIQKNNYFKPDPNFEWQGLKPDKWGHKSIKIFPPKNTNVFDDGMINWMIIWSHLTLINFIILSFAINYLITWLLNFN